MSQDIDGVSKIKDGYNPATWMLEVSTTAQELALGVDFAEIYRNSQQFRWVTLYTLIAEWCTPPGFFSLIKPVYHHRRNKALIRELSVPHPGTKDLYFPTQYSKPFLVQFIACLWKQRLSYWRNPSYTAVRFAFTTFIAIIFGTMFWDLGGKR